MKFWFKKTYSDICRVVWFARCHLRSVSNVALFLVFALNYEHSQSDEWYPNRFPAQNTRILYLPFMKCRSVLIRSIDSIMSHRWHIWHYHYYPRRYVMGITIQYSRYFHHFTSSYTPLIYANVEKRFEKEMNYVSLARASKRSIWLIAQAIGYVNAFYPSRRELIYSYIGILRSLNRNDILVRRRNCILCTKGKKHLFATREQMSRAAKQSTYFRAFAYCARYARAEKS